MPSAGRMRVVTFVCVAAVLNTVCGVHVLHDPLHGDAHAESRTEQTLRHGTDSTHRSSHRLPACVRSVCTICAFLASYAALQPEAAVATGWTATARGVPLPVLGPVLEPDNLGSGSPRAPPSQPA
jgi:hypothetical protein